LFFACSDSRVVPNLFASTHPGELFLHRNVGNLIPKDCVDKCANGAHKHSSDPEPANEQIEDHKKDDNFVTRPYSAGAAIEFAILNLGVREIIVCGHSSCGAMKASLRGVSGETPHLRQWLYWMEDSRSRYIRKDYTFKLMIGGEIQEVKATFDENLPDYDRLSQLNVLQQLENLTSYSLVQNSPYLHLHAWWFNIPTADIYFFSVSLGKFVLIDTDTATELLAHLGDTSDELKKDMLTRKLTKRDSAKELMNEIKTNYSKMPRSLSDQSLSTLVSREREKEKEKEKERESPIKNVDLRSLSDLTKSPPNFVLPSPLWTQDPSIQKKLVVMDDDKEDESTLTTEQGKQIIDALDRIEHLLKRLETEQERKKKFEQEQQQEQQEQQNKQQQPQKDQQKKTKQ